MKLLIGQRLFGAVLLSYLLMGAIGLGLARWHLGDGARTASSPRETEAIAALTAELKARYLAQRDWSFLPSDAAQRRDWLQGELLRLQSQPHEASPDGDRVSPTLGSRLGLVDASGQLLAGRVPGRALIAAASIDTRVSTLAVEGEAVARLVESRSDNPQDELAVAFLLDQQGHLLIVAGLGVTLGVALAASLAGYFRRPIRQLVAGARELGAGRFEARLHVDRSDELGELAAAFNQLAARLERAEQERAQWVADTSHELRTPLAVVRAQIEAMQDGIRPATPEHLAVMLRQILALTRLVDDLAALAQPQVGELTYAMVRVDLWALVEDAAVSFSDKAQAAGLLLEIGDAPERSVVRGDASRLRQVLSNLLENSLRYTSAGGRIQISAREEAEVIQILIDDSPPGVPEELLGRLGERLFRAEPSRSRASGGAGLGLAICVRIVEGHGGRVSFAPSMLGGLQVAVVLPLGDAP